MCQLYLLYQQLPPLNVKGDPPPGPSILNETVSLVDSVGPRGESTLETVVLPTGPVPGGHPGEVLDADSMQRSTVGLEEQAMGEPASLKTESMSSLGHTVRDRMRNRLKKKQVS